MDLGFHSLWVVPVCIFPNTDLLARPLDKGATNFAQSS